MRQEIIPMLTYENSVAAMEWLSRVFGFREKAKWLDKQGFLTHVEMMMGENIIMLRRSRYQVPRRGPGGTKMDVYSEELKTGMNLNDFI